MPARLGFVLKCYPRLSETFVAQEILLLERAGLEIEIFSLRQPLPGASQPLHEEILAKITYLPNGFTLLAAALAREFLLRPSAFVPELSHSMRKAWQRRSLRPLKRLAQAAWLVAHKGPALRHLHAHFLHAPSELAFYVAKLGGPPFSVSAHAKDIYTTPEQDIRERIAACRFLLTCTEFNAKHLQALAAPADRHKIHRNYHGVNISYFQPAQVENSRLRLLTVARMVEKKGFHTILDALSLMQKEQVDFTYEIFGAGPLFSPMEAKARALGLLSRITFHGAVPQPRVQAAYAGGGVFVLACRETRNGDRDGIPNALAEAMSAGLAVVATEISGIPELVSHEKNGLLVPPENPQALAAALARLGTDPALRYRLGQAARATIEQNFDAAKAITHCHALLAEAVQ